MRRSYQRGINNK